MFDYGLNVSYNTFMKLTLQLQLLPTAEQKVLLLATMEAFNKAASHAARVGFDSGYFSRPNIHKQCYYDLRRLYGLSSQMACHAIGKAVDCFTRDKTRCPVFKPYGAMTLDNRLFGFKGPALVSILTLKGRELIAYICGSYQRERFDRLKGQADLVYKNDKFYLICTADMPEDAPIEVKKFLGVDMGVAHIVATSDGNNVSGASVEKIRQKHHAVRRSLGKRMSEKRSTRRNARRAMKRIGNKEQRFRRHQNHVISKQLVVLAKGTGRGIAIEDLKHIRDRTRFRKSQRAKMGGWAFAQLRQFLTYKGKLCGVSVITVHPRNSSRTCSSCGHCEKANRKSQDKFQCLICGFTCNADINAAINLAARALVIAPQESEPNYHLAS